MELAHSMREGRRKSIMEAAGRISALQGQMLSLALGRPTLCFTRPLPVDSVHFSGAVGRGGD